MTFGVSQVSLQLVCESIYGIKSFKMKLVFATHNSNKAKEIQSLLPSDFQILTLTAINSNVKVSGYLNLVDQISAPGDAGGVNKLYSTATTGPGDTGLYFVNTRSGENFEVTGAAPEELVSKKRAILFSMIF